MDKIYKIIIIISFIPVLVGTTSQMLLNINSTLASPDDSLFSDDSLFCDEPIPIGSALDTTDHLLKEIYQKYKKLQLAVETQTHYAQNLVAQLNATSGICSFDKCEAHCERSPAKLGVAVEPSETIGAGLSALGLGGVADKLKKEVISADIPICAPWTMCTGQACPEIHHLVEVIADFHRTQIKPLYDNITNFTASTTEFITSDIMLEQEGEKPGDKITAAEFIRRKLELAREWLTPAFGPKKTCALTTLEKARVLKGEIPERVPMRCIKALEERLYWPRPWSENCTTACEQGFTQDCKDCLACKGCTSDKIDEIKNSGSPLARVNYKIYALCKDRCHEELTDECYNCLSCAKFSAPGECSEYLSDDESMAWLCGGSPSNWVCCHSWPLERE